MFALFWVTFSLVGCNLKRFQENHVWHPCVVVGTPRYPQMVEKFFKIIFSAYLLHSKPLLLWTNAIWRGFQKSQFWPPCVVVGTHRYPQLVQNIFLIVFTAYLHHSEPLFLWSNAIWRDFSKIPFFDPYPGPFLRGFSTPQCFKNTPDTNNSQWDTMRKILVKKLFWL